jgi:hypothetical protein
LDESDDPLAKLYSQILRFVERDLCRIMDVAEKISMKSVASVRGDSSPALTPNTAADRSIPRADGQGFNIMANVVWDELGRAIMDHLGSTIFAAGRPDEFRKVGFSPHGWYFY